VQRVGIEACCGAADLAEQLVEQAGWNCSLGHPAYVAKLKGSPDKSDCRHGRWSKAWMACVRDNSRLSGHARWIVNDLLDEIELAERKISRVEMQLRLATCGDRVIERLMKQEGIGEVTAWVLRAYIGEFGRFARGKQLARYCGMSPCNASTGKKQADAGLIDGCNRLLRATVVQAAHRLIRGSARWKALAEQMRSRGKPANVIVGAVGNRWLRNLHHAMKEEKSR
jgi:transposase